LPRLASPCLALPRLASPCLALPRLASPHINSLNISISKSIMLKEFKMKHFWITFLYVNKMSILIEGLKRDLNEMKWFLNKKNLTSFKTLFKNYVLITKFIPGMINSTLFIEGQSF
jgi:hypothetical protein